ncbi:MAG: hypothetical protein GY715_09370 [Planctomycetes bacterium]|nr:hypothetical protein [Planctomycetota bacterium]
MLDRALVVGVALLAASVTAPVSAQVATALLQEAGPLPGVPGETIFSLNNPAVNHVGGYAVSTNTNGSGTTLSHGFGNATGGAGAVLQTEGTIGTLEQTSFESFIGLSNAGDLAYSALANDTGGGSTGLDGAWLADTVVLNEEDAVTALPGQFSSFNSRVGVTGDGQPYWVGGITSAPGGATHNRVLFLGLGAAAVLKGGDPVVGIAETVSTGSGGIDIYVRFSAAGTNYIIRSNVNSGSSLNDGVLVMNGAAVMAGGSIVREQSPVPAAIGGLTNELWDNFDYMGITEAGQWLTTGDTDAATSLDEIVVHTGQIILREGDVLTYGGEDVTISGAMESGYLNEDGDWAVVWDVNATAGNIETLIFNGEVELAEGDLVDWTGDGVIDAADDGAEIIDFTGINALAVGARIGNLVSVYFTADVVFDSVPDVLEGFFCLRLDVAVAPCPEDLSGNGQVDFADILAVIAAWGPCGVPCPEDLSGNGQVDFADILAVIGAWGACP